MSSPRRLDSVTKALACRGARASAGTTTSGARPARSTDRLTPTRGTRPETGLEDLSGAALVVSGARGKHRGDSGGQKVKASLFAHACTLPKWVFQLMPQRPPTVGIAALMVFFAASPGKKSALNLFLSSSAKALMHQCLVAEARWNAVWHFSRCHRHNHASMRNFCPTRTRQSPAFFHDAGASFWVAAAIAMAARPSRAASAANCGRVSLPSSAAFTRRQISVLARGLRLSNALL